MNPGLLFLLFLAVPGFAQTPLADDPLMDLATVDNTILVELRYATVRNIAGKALYPPGARCIVRRHVAEGLKVAQAWLKPRGYALKIWDAWRPMSAQQALWELSKNRSFVASPENGRSLHTWGAAVDATLVDARGREMKMPTDLDDFSPAAAMKYRGDDPVVAQNLTTLQQAMGRGGFIGMRTEWWHFIGKNWRACKPVQVDSMLAVKGGRWSPPPAPPAPVTTPPPAHAPRSQAAHQPSATPPPHAAPPPRAVIALPTVPAPPAADSPPPAIPPQQPGK